MHSKKQKNKRQEKKSETLEVRLPYSAKTKFMEKCATQNETASHVLRGFINTHISNTSGAGQRTQTPRKPISVLIAASALAISLYFSVQPLSEMLRPKAPRTSPVLLSMLDTNKDGYLTATDARDETRHALFRLLENNDANEDGKLSAKEMGALKTITMTDKDFAVIMPTSMSMQQGAHKTFRLEVSDESPLGATLAGLQKNETMMSAPNSFFIRGLTDESAQDPQER